MAARESLPGEFFLDGIVIEPDRRLFVGHQQDVGNYAKPGQWDAEAWRRAEERGRYVALRWVLNPALGIPLEPFTVWRRPAWDREKASSIPGLRRAGTTYTWGGVSEMMTVEIDLSSPTTVTGLHRADLRPVQVVSGAANTTVVLDAGPMLGVRVDNPNAVAQIRGLSLVEMANGDGWEPFEIVGLPFSQEQLNATYYSGGQQGPVGSLTDPFSAAVQRIESWGPVLGWAPLGGLDPWRAPDAKPLVEEMQDDLLPSLARVLVENPPPAVGDQIKAEFVRKLAELHQIVGTKAKQFNTGAVGDRAELTVRPLQALTTSVATDTWSSLALGFGTGDSINADMEKVGVDYMVTAPWDGLMKRAVPNPFPFPLPGLVPEVVDQEVQRELATIVLAPQQRPAPGAPAPVTTRVGHDEGAAALDSAYQTNIVIKTTRTETMPREPRASGYALARFDDPGDGSYQLRAHPLAGGWITISASTPVPEPGTPPDPNNPPSSVTLRNSGVPRPITGPPSVCQYYLAASDLFGQWSPWSTAWCSVDAAAVQAPVIAGVKARASGSADPCMAKVTTEFVWDRRERTLHRLQIVVDAYTLPAPPAAIGAPPDSPQGGAVTLNTLTIEFDATGRPITPGVDIVAIHDDGTQIASPALGGLEEHRYRLVLDHLPLTFAGRTEVGVAVYLSAEETVRPLEWSGWSHPREAAVVPNPIPPPPPAPLPAVYPTWASLPDAAGLSYATVDWAPFGAWRYRVYEATEAALRAACGQPGPVLTDDYGTRMQALFDLYKVPANLPKLKKAFRKLGTEPVLPPVVNGRMQYQALLPRGSSLIHCYIVVGVTESNVTSPWPLPDGDGRKGFDGFAIPHVRRTSQPQLRARLDPASGVPEVTVLLDGAVPATGVRLYRADNAILARSVGTMTLVGEFAPGAEAPDLWRHTVIDDPAALTGWSHLQYRAVAVTNDDLPRAGAAVPSEPSRSYALLNPPADPPKVVLTPNVQGTTATVSVVRVDTDALRTSTDIGDFSVACTTSPATVGIPFGSSLNTVPDFASTSDLVASAEVAGYVAGVLHLRVERQPGQEVALGVDVTDPLGRSTHGLVVIPGTVPEPPPAVSMHGVRVGGAVRLRIDTNVPLPPDPGSDWTLSLAWRRLFNWPPMPAQTHDFLVSTIPTVPDEAAMPDPASDPAAFAIARVGGTDRILVWFRTYIPVDVGVQLTNSVGQTDMATEIL